MIKPLFVLMLSFCIFSVGAVLALDCDYEDNSPYSKEIIVFYENGTKLDYNLLEVRDIKQGDPGSRYFGVATAMEFKVYNNYNSEVNVTVDYIFSGQLQSVGALIASKGYYSVTGPTSPGLDENTINFDIQTLGLEAKRESTRFDNYSCTQCPERSNFTCLNDGQNCTDSSQCGGGHCVRGYCSDSSSCFNNDCKCSVDELQCGDNSQCVKKNSVQLGFKPVCRVEECVTGYLNKNGACALKNGEKCSINDDCVSGTCNPARVCGEFNGQCPEGEKLCNNQTCLKTSYQLADQPYSCNWECTNGTIACSGICRAVSSKKAGEEYSCIEECESGRGKDGICLKTMVWWVYFWIICIIVLLGSYGYFKKYLADKAKRERDKAKKERDEIKGEIDKNKIVLLKLKKDKEDIDKKIVDAKSKYDQKDKELSGKLERADALAKEEVEKEIQEERRSREKELNLLRELKEENRVKFEKEKMRQDEKKKELEDSMEKTKELMTHPFLNNQRYKVLLNEDGYEVCSWDKNKSFHVWWYEKNSGEKVNSSLFEVHHIDGDKRNNEYSNLIKIGRDVHQRIHRFERKWFGREKGLELLKKYNVDVPQRIEEPGRLD